MIIKPFTSNSIPVIQNTKYFTSHLLKWNAKHNNRMMPWKGEKDPYKIWLSEIILQQTRVEQGWEYYNRFIAAWPDITRLAKTPSVQVFKMWEGLGYYTRCKNLILTAQHIAVNLGGEFPQTYDAILQLNGVGPYTAAAISSFAYNLPHAVIDGNVSRVLARFFGISIPIDSTEGKKLFSKMAGELLDLKQPGHYNQALMDFGATVCKPQSPLCSTCPLKTKCKALLNNQVSLLPVKNKKPLKRTRWFYYFVIEYKGHWYLRKRVGKDIWQNLFEFVLFESVSSLAVNKLRAHPQLKKIFAKATITNAGISPVYRQELTHQSIRGRFIHIKTNKLPDIKEYKAVPVNKMFALPFPKFITTYLADKQKVYS